MMNILIAAGIVFPTGDGNGSSSDSGSSGGDCGGGGDGGGDPVRRNLDPTQSPVLEPF